MVKIQIKISWVGRSTRGGARLMESFRDWGYWTISVLTLCECLLLLVSSKSERGRRLLPRLLLLLTSQKLCVCVCHSGSLSPSADVGCHPIHLLIMLIPMLLLLQSIYFASTIMLLLIAIAWVAEESMVELQQSGSKIRLGWEWQQSKRGPRLDKALTSVSE